MSNIIILIIMFVVGFALRKTNKVKEDDYKTINTLLINVFLPSLIVFYLHSVKFDFSLMASASMPYLLTAIGCGFFILAGKLFGFSRETVGCLILTASAGNTAFLGLPVVQALVGKEAMPMAIAVDQLGSTPCALTVGILLAGYFSSEGKGFNLVATIKKILTFPPFIATVLALGFSIGEVSLSADLVGALEKLSACVAPLALLSVGMQLHLEGWKENIKPLALGLAFRVFLAPMLVAAFFLATGHGLGTTEKTLLIDSMMGSQITSMVIAQQYNLNDRLAALMMSVSVPLSIIVSVLVFYLM